MNYGARVRTSAIEPLPCSLASAACLLTLVGGCAATVDREQEVVATQSSALTNVTHTAIGIRAGEAHSCALLDNSQIKCWGGNWQGQLGYGDNQNRADQSGEMGTALPYVDLGGQYSASAIAVGDEHTCALLDDGQVKCWGDNYYGELGLGDTNNRGDYPGEMGTALPTVNLGTGRFAKQLVAGGYHTCVLLDTNQVKCWGQNTFGQLGLGNTNHRGDNPNEMGDNLPVVNLGSGRTALAITAGYAHTCAILDNYQLKCWGYNSNGQLGLGDTNHRGDNAGEMGDSLPVVKVRNNANQVSAVSAGFGHTCAITRSDNALKCWGYNALGELGLGDTIQRGDNAGEMADALPYVSLGTGRKAASIGAAYYHTCVLLDNKATKCFGYNYDGELGKGNTAALGDNPNEMGDALTAIDLGTGRAASAISTRAEHTCAILDNGQVKCWGYNEFGRLGLGDQLSRGDNPNEMGTNLNACDLGYGKLSSKFFRVNPIAMSIIKGATYDVNDPALRDPNTLDYNKSAFGYKVFAALHMLGYDTMAGQHGPGTLLPPVVVLKQFQANNGFAVESVLRQNVLDKMDALLAQREPGFASVAQQFPLYANHMLPLARNDASKDFVAMLYELPMLKLPGFVQMSSDETVQCIDAQCVGDIDDIYGNSWPTYPVDLTQDYRFVGAYYQPNVPASQLASAAENLHTILHEYGHYLDSALIYDPREPRNGIVNTSAFYNVGYDLSRQNVSGCAPRRSNDVHDWLSRYGFYGDNSSGCPSGWAIPFEDWAESFAFYVTAGKRFRSAAVQRPMIAARYNFLKTQVFAGMEFNTDLQTGLSSGCTDAPGAFADGPGYLSCSETAVWDGTLPTL